jgi:hypothetical protein
LLLRAACKNLCFDLVAVLVLPLFFFLLGILLPEQVRFPINVSFAAVRCSQEKVRCQFSRSFVDFP